MMAHGQPIYVTLSDYICLCNHVLYCMKKVARLSNREFTHLCMLLVRVRLQSKLQSTATFPKMCLLASNQSDIILPAN